MAVICILCMIGRQSIRATFVDIWDNKMIRTNIPAEIREWQDSEPSNFHIQLTNARDSISRESCMARAVEGSFSVGTIGVRVTVVCICLALVYIWWKDPNKAGTIKCGEKDVWQMSKRHDHSMTHKGNSLRCLGKKQVSSTIILKWKYKLKVTSYITLKWCKQLN